MPFIRVKNMQVPSKKGGMDSVLVINKEFFDLKTALEKSPLTPYEGIQIDLPEMDSIKPENALLKFRAMVIDYLQGKKGMKYRVTIRLNPKADPKSENKKSLFVYCPGDAE